MEIKDEYIQKFDVQEKVQYEFQELGLEIQAVLGKGIWPIFHQKGNTNEIMKRAWKEFNTRKFSYFMFLLKQVKEGKIK